MWNIGILYVHRCGHSNKNTSKILVQINNLELHAICFQLAWKLISNKRTSGLLDFCFLCICVTCMVPWIDNKVENYLNPCITSTKSSPPNHLMCFMKTPFFTTTNSCKTKWIWTCQLQMSPYNKDILLHYGWACKENRRPKFQWVLPMCIEYFFSSNVSISSK